MLFTQHINTLNSGITSIQNRIDELEAILKGLRNDKTNLEAELQTVLTLEGAAESAINQAQSFVNAADSMGRTDLIATFWQAMDAMQKGAIAQLPSATPEPEPEYTPEPSPSPEPEVTPEPEPKTEVITVEVIEQPEPTTEPEVITQPESVGSGAFSTKDATLEELKEYVRNLQTDDKTKAHGKLSQRSTWVMAAKSLMNISDYTKA